MEWKLSDNQLCKILVTDSVGESYVLLVISGYDVALERETVLGVAILD